MKKYLFLLFTMLTLNFANAQSSEQLIQQFFETYTKSTDKAIDDIYLTNKWTSTMQDAISSLKKTVRNYPEELGKYYGSEIITQQKCTERFILYSYMAKYDRQPVKITFEFYKPNDNWLLYSLNFISDIDEDVEMAAKFAIQNPENK